MPSGKVHDRITVLTAVAAVPAWWVLSPVRDPLPLLVTLAAYVFSGVWLSQDLDTNSMAYKRWGLFKWIWWPYRKFVPHRSWISHGLGGPLIRVGYFGLMLWAVARGVMWLMKREGMPVNRDALLAGVWHNGLAWTLSHPSIAVCVAVGLVLGGVAHSLVDGFVSLLKRAW